MSTPATRATNPTKKPKNLGLTPNKQTTNKQTKRSRQVSHFPAAALPLATRRSRELRRDTWADRLGRRDAPVLWRDAPVLRRALAWALRDIFRRLPRWRESLPPPPDSTKRSSSASGGPLRVESSTSRSAARSASRSALATSRAATSNAPGGAVNPEPAEPATVREAPSAGMVPCCWTRLVPDRLIRINRRRDACWADGVGLSDARPGRTKLASSAAIGRPAGRETDATRRRPVPRPVRREPGERATDAGAG